MLLSFHDLAVCQQNSCARMSSLLAHRSTSKNSMELHEVLSKDKNWSRSRRQILHWPLMSQIRRPPLIPRPNVIGALLIIRLLVEDEIQQISITALHRSVTALEIHCELDVHSIANFSSTFWHCALFMANIRRRNLQTVEFHHDPKESESLR